MKLFIPALLLFVISHKSGAQCGAYPTMKGQVITGLTVGGGYYTGLIQYLPTDYAANPTKKYPVIIYFHGDRAKTTGDAPGTGPCKILTDVASTDISTTIPNWIEDGAFGANVVPTVGGTSFIVIAPQYSTYGEPYHYSNQTDAMIDYIVANYQVDESRIYLTGMSTGANQVMDYLSSSLARSQRIAAAGFGALCLPTSLSSSPNGAANVAAGEVATWFTHCITENSGFCGISTPQGWVNDINANTPVRAPRFTILQATAPGGTVYPQTLNYCRGFAHDAWSALYSPDFAPTSGPGPDFYEWALQFTSAASLPVTLKSFTARLSNGKVYLRWVTSSEQENAGFVIERAGANGAYSNLTQIGGGGSTTGDKIYEYVDESPLTNLSFYRLKQQDLNGRFKLFEARKVMNKSRYKSMVLITPNPFTSDPSAFVTIDKRQRISVWLSDMSGRVLSTVNGVYEEGTTELSLPVGNLPRGVYFVKVSGENITETHKIIKQ